MIFRRASVRLFGGRTGVSFQVSTGTSPRTGCQLELTLCSCVCHKAPHGDIRAQAVDHKCRNPEKRRHRVRKTCENPKKHTSGRNAALPLPPWLVCPWVFQQLFLECLPPPKPQAEVSATCQHRTLSDRLCAQSLPGAALWQSRRLQPPTVTSCPMVPSFLRSLESLYLASSLLCSWSTVRGVLSTGVCASFVRTLFLIRSLLLSERAHHVHGDPSFFRDRFASVHDVVLLSLIPSDISSPNQTEKIAAFGQSRHQRNVRLLR